VVAVRRDGDRRCGTKDIAASTGFDQSSSELGVVELTTLTGDLSGASIDSLLSEVRRRVLAANAENAQPWPTGWSADDPGVSRPQDVEQSGDLGG
jgi:hypothetical protein